MNVYAYVNGNVVNLVDPMGLARIVVLYGPDPNGAIGTLRAVFTALAAKHPDDTIEQLPFTNRNIAKHQKAADRVYILVHGLKPHISFEQIDKKKTTEEEDELIHRFQTSVKNIDSEVDNYTDVFNTRKADISFIEKVMGSEIRYRNFGRGITKLYGEKDVGFRRANRMERVLNRTPGQFLVFGAGGKKRKIFGKGLLFDKEKENVFWISCNSYWIKTLPECVKRITFLKRTVDWEKKGGHPYRVFTASMLPVETKRELDVYLSTH